MYNRYIPQPDGSFQRNHVPEQAQPERPSPPPPLPMPEQPTPPPEQKPPGNGPVPGFLRRIFPPNFDTGDLIVVLLLLLLAGDCQEERSTALLTLALYLCM